MDILSTEYREGLLIDFGTLHKVIRASDHIIEEISSGLVPLNKCENHIIRATEGLHETEAIPFEVVCLIYDGVEDIPGSVFRLLENYLLQNYVFDTDISSSVNLYTRDKVFKNYKQLGELIGKPINEGLSNFTNPLYITDQRETKQKNKSQYKNDKIYALTELTANIASNTLQLTVNPELIDSIIQVFEFDISEIFDFEELIELLSDEGIITPREKSYFRTMNTHIDIARYLKIILSNDETFINSLSPEQLEELENCFYALDMYCGETIENQILQNNQTRGLIIDMGIRLVHSMLIGNLNTIDHNFLNSVLELLEEYFPYKPFYLRVIHAEFDEIVSLDSLAYKSMQILGILVSDVLDAHNPIFEDASELFLVSVIDKKTHAAVKNICDEKIKSIQ